MPEKTSHVPLTSRQTGPRPRTSRRSSSSAYLLVEMDGLHGNSGVITIAATKRVDSRRGIDL